MKNRLGDLLAYTSGYELLVVCVSQIIYIGCVCKLRASNKTSVQSLKSLDKGLEELLGDEP